jgi:hypothetical protein
MRIAIAILLFLSISFQCFVKLGVVVWFNYNKDYIAKNLCENRDKPHMKCCGKCYLKKKLNKVNDEQNRPGSVPMKWDKGEMPVFLIPAATFAFNTIIADDLLTHRSGYDLSLVTRPHPSVFHPPLV